MGLSSERTQCFIQKAEVQFSACDVLEKLGLWLLTAVGREKPLEVSAVVRVVLFPPISYGTSTVEQMVALTGKTGIVDFLDSLKAESLFAGYFTRMAKYGSSGDLLHDLIVMVNGKLADESCFVYDGDEIKLLLPLAGG